ncbi:MAG: hypothetical protein ABSC24_05570 [Verrucomicrobiota bacterium]|jgi:hypothetical protein
MNENQPNFESLRRLLALKRHETPPPGYFNNFSSQVMARIRDGETEAAESWSGRLFASMPWLMKVIQAVDTRPVFAGGFATALCALLLFGAVIAQRPDSASTAFMQPAAPETGSFASATPAAPSALQPVNQFMVADNSTNPVFSSFQTPAPASFGQIPVGAQFVNYSSSGN